VIEARKILGIIGAKAFGTPDSATVSAIERIHDLARLEDLCLRVGKVSGWQELLGQPAARRRGSRPPRARRRDGTRPAGD
jgi:hypothetical protein